MGEQVYVFTSPLINHASLSAVLTGKQYSCYKGRRLKPHLCVVSTDWPTTSVRVGEGAFLIMPWPHQLNDRPVPEQNKEEECHILRSTYLSPNPTKSILAFSVAIHISVRYESNTCSAGRSSHPVLTAWQGCVPSRVDWQVLAHIFHGLCWSMIPYAAWSPGICWISQTLIPHLQRAEEGTGQVRYTTMERERVQRFNTYLRFPIGNHTRIHLIMIFLIIKNILFWIFMGSDFHTIKSLNRNLRTRMV